MERNHLPPLFGDLGRCFKMSSTLLPSSPSRPPPPTGVSTRPPCSLLGRKYKLVASRSARLECTLASQRSQQAARCWVNGARRSKPGPVGRVNWNMKITPHVQRATQHTGEPQPGPSGKLLSRLLVVSLASALAPDPR